MVVFVSDNLFLSGNPDENGVVQTGIEVTPWNEFARVRIDADVLVLDMDLEAHVSQAGRHSVRAVENNEREYFREVFQTLYERAISHLNQGGVLVVLMANVAPIPASNHFSRGRVTSYDFLERLDVISECKQINRGPINVKTDNSDVRWYLDTSGDQYAFSILNEVKSYSSVLATKRDGDPIAAAVRAYRDDTQQLRTELGNIILLPQPRTWSQNLVKIARCIEEIGLSEIDDHHTLRRYEARSETSASDFLEDVLRRFPKAAGVLSTEDGNGKFEMESEDDVQDLLEAGLNLYFDDVRSEVSVEDYAGSGGRIDFIIPDANAGIEVKITREDRSRAKLVEEIEKAKASYTRHSLVDVLYIFIYVSHRSHIPNVPSLRDDIEEDGDVPVRLLVTT